MTSFSLSLRVYEGEGRGGERRIDPMRELVELQREQILWPALPWNSSHAARLAANVYDTTLIRTI